MQRPAAWVYAEEGYEPLGIAPGANCLLMHQRRDQWYAKMVPMETNASVDCLQDVGHEAAEGKDLLVRIVSGPGFEDDDYIQPARLEYDRFSKEQYIAIGCGGAWCEVGNPLGFSSSGVYEYHRQGDDRKGRRVSVIKAYFDEQHLAVPDPASGQLVPSALIGTVFPGRDLDQWNQDSDFYPPWKLVSRVALRVDKTVNRDPDLTRDDIQWYKTKMNYNLTKPYGDLNETYLCVGTASECRVPTEIWDGTHCADLGRAHWWARIRGAGEELRDAKYFCVGHHDSPEPPPTNRWRWSVGDEGKWVRCAMGCCEILGGE